MRPADHVGWSAMSSFSLVFIDRISSLCYLVNAYGLNGMGAEAVKHFHMMPSDLINEVTLICVLNACSHSGLVDQARSIFSKIPDKTEMIYATMVH